MNQYRQYKLPLFCGALFFLLCWGWGVYAIDLDDKDSDPVTNSSPINWLTPTEPTPSSNRLLASQVYLDEGDTRIIAQAEGNFGDLDDSSEGEKFLLSFNDLSIVEVLRFISKISGKNFIFNEEDLAFNVTIVSQEPASVDNIMAALLQVLRIRGLSMLEQGNNIVIHANKAVTRLPRLTGEGIDEIPTDETELVTHVYRMNNISVDRASALIKPLISGDAQVEVLAETRHIVLTDFSGNVARVTRLLDEIDKPTVPVEVGQYLVRNRDLEPLVELVRELMIPVVGSQPFSLVPSPVSNSIFVVSTPFLVDRTIGVLQTLDMTARQTRIMNVDRIKYLPIDAEGRIIPPKGQDVLSTSRNAGVNAQIDMKGLGALDEADANPESLTGAELEEGEGNELFRPSSPEGFGVGSSFGEDGPGRFFDDLNAEDQIRLDSRLFEGALGDESAEGVAGPTDSLFGAKVPKRFRIRKLHHRKSDALAESLGLIADSLEGADSHQDDLVLALRSIQSITETNSLVFTGVETAADEVDELIAELDSPTRQVFIELLIFQTTVLNSLQFGVDWGSKAELGSRYTFAAASQNQAGTDLIGATAASSLATPTGLAAATVGRVISYKGKNFLDFAAVIRALEEESSTNIVMNPKILVQDGVTAEVFVGENRPFQTTTTSVEGSTNVERSFEYRDIGSRVTVTPFIGEGEFITLEVDQEISSDTGEQEEEVETTQSLASSTLRTTTTTTIHVPSGHFVVLSGQIRESRTFERRGVPCLGTLPWLGNFFSFKQLSDPEKSNLMIFIRPTVVDTTEEMRRMTRDQQSLLDRKSNREFSQSNEGRERWKYRTEQGAYEWINPGETCFE